MRVSFDPRATRYSLSNAVHLLRCSLEAYRDPAEAEANIVGEWGLESARHFEGKHGVEGLLIEASAYRVLAFRGSDHEGPGDWITNARVRLAEGPLGGRVHVGFRDAVAEVWEELTRWLNLDDRPTWWTGHSQGAGLAIVGAARAWAEGLPVTGVMSFGQPRVGDQGFRDAWLDDGPTHTWRVIWNNDPVPWVPAGPFRHVGEVRRHMEDGRVLTEQSEGRPHPREEDGPSPRGASDHDVSRYRDGLERALSAAGG